MYIFFCTTSAPIDTPAFSDSALLCTAWAFSCAWSRSDCTPSLNDLNRSRPTPVSPYDDTPGGQLLRSLDVVRPGYVTVWLSDVS